MSREAAARAGTNIALVKYWGKRDASLNLPAAGSLSLTLAELGTTTHVRFDDRLDRDEVQLNGVAADERTARRVAKFLDLVRAQAGLSARAHVRSRNQVPTAAGLASSASAFAALALAATRAAGLEVTPLELSVLARRGSGSAARSIYGGLVEMQPGTRADGVDAGAHPLLPPDAWDLRLCVAITATGAKAIGSTEAMDHTARTSPYYAAWIASVDADLAAARAAIAARDLRALGVVTERSALRMHACAMAADPAVVYWNPATLAALQTVHELRAGGVPVYATMDAGPHVKALCVQADSDVVQRALAATAGVLSVLVAAPGPGVTLLPADAEGAL